MRVPPFHLAIPVHDLVAARQFYVELLGCGVGRTAAEWIDFDLRGHQVTAHLVTRAEGSPETNPVDGHDVPSRHFGLILDWAEWETLSAKLEAAGTEFVIRPTVRFKGRPGEQATLFIRDPSGNALEFKAFRDPRNVFAAHE